MFSKIFDELNISSNARLIFTALMEHGPMTARQLAERVDIPRPSIYDHVKSLMQKDLVAERTEENKKVFFIDKLENIPDLIQEKIDILQKEKKNATDALPTLLKQVQFYEPKIKFYSGIDGVRQAMNTIMWDDNIETILMWPMSEMAKVLGEDYLADLNKKRIKRNISIRGIWPEDKKLDFRKYPFLGVGGRHMRDLRLAPKGMTWNMGYWMYADKVIFLSSRKEMFAFVVNSKDFTELIKAQFEIIWNISKPVKPQPEYTDTFLESIGEK